jgi:hypothetical protein
MRSLSIFGRTGSFSGLVDAIQYDLAPYLGRNGAGVWIEEMSQDSVVVGFECSRACFRQELWNWLKVRIDGLVPAGDRARVILRDFSG